MLPLDTTCLATHALPPELIAPERLLLLQARHVQAVKARYLVLAVSLVLALADAAVDLVAAPWSLLLGFAGVIAAANGAAHLASRRGHAHLWHFWALLGIDTLLTGANVAVLGAYGYIGLLVFLTAIGAHALGLPRAGRVQLAAALLVYPAARAVGLEIHADSAPRTVVLETACLAGLGWLALQGPARFTHRVRRARRALGALERGDFAARLPTKALADLGFLGPSFNRTAEVLGEAVEGLRCSEARFRSLVQHSSDVILIVGADRRVRYVSSSVEHEYG